MSGGRKTPFLTSPTPDDAHEEDSVTPVLVLDDDSMDMKELHSGNLMIESSTLYIYGHHLITARGTHDSYSIFTLFQMYHGPSGNDWGRRPSDPYSIMGRGEGEYCADRRGCQV